MCLEQRVRELENDTIKHTLLLDSLIARMDDHKEKNDWFKRMVLTTLFAVLIVPALLLLFVTYLTSVAP